MITVLIGICLISLVCLFVFLVKSSFRKKKNIISSILVILVSLVLIVAVKNYEDKVEAEQKVKQEQIARENAESKLKLKEELEIKEKVDAEQKEQEMTEQKIEVEKLAKEQAEAEQKIAEEESQKINNIDKAKSQLVGKKYTIAPLLYDDMDASKAMAENKAPQNLMHDGMKNITFNDDNTAHIGLAGTYRPDMDVSYTLSENMLVVGQDNIPYLLSNGVISFDTWTTSFGEHTITWSITASN